MVRHDAVIVLLLFTTAEFWDGADFCQSDNSTVIPQLRGEARRFEISANYQRLLRKPKRTE